MVTSLFILHLRTVLVGEHRTLAEDPGAHSQAGAVS